MKKIVTLLSMFAIACAMTACNTWQGVKADARDAGQAAGRGIEKAGEKIQKVSE